MDGPIVPSNVSSSEEEQKKLEHERDEYLEGWKRAKADLINYKKEEMERMREFAKFANEAVVYDMLSIVDSFDLGLATLPENDPGRKGMEVIRAQFLDIMRRHGVEVLKADTGKPFDAATDEAVGEIESGVPPGTVAEIVSRGYSLNGKVVRPTRVRISKGQLTKT